MEEQTIENIDKVEKVTLKKHWNLIDVDPMLLLIHNLDNYESNVQPGEQHDDVDDQQLGGGLYVPIDDDQ